MDELVPLQKTISHYKKDVGNVKAYRMLHVGNLKHVKQYGLTTRISENRNDDYVAIGDSSLIESRDNSSEQGFPGLEECVGFYFGPRQPMLLKIQSGWDGITLRKPNEIVYACIELKNIINKQNVFFTDGHLSAFNTKKFTGDRIEDINKIVDWNAVFAIQWKDQLDTDKKRRKQAELHIIGDIPFCAISHFYFHDNSAMQDVGITEISSVKPSWYY